MKLKTAKLPGVWTGVIVLFLCLLATGCGGEGREDPILRLSAEEALTEGKRLLEDEKFQTAGEYFAHAFQTAPNSAVGRSALLLQADALFASGREYDLIRAEAKYRDFNNRYPTSDEAAYVQLQIAGSLEKRARSPERDQSETRKAIEAYEELLALYPTSEHALNAEEGILRLRQSLAEHEFHVARYQLRRGLFSACVSRLEGVLENFADYQQIDKILFNLGLAKSKLKAEGSADEAKEVFARLRSEFPQSEYLRKIPKGY